MPCTWKVFMILLWGGPILCFDTLYANDADNKVEAELLVICGAVTVFFSPLTAANTVLFCRRILSPRFLRPCERNGGNALLLIAQNPHSPLFNFLSSSCEISGADATLATRDIWARGLAEDGWRSIYITLPGASSLLPSPRPLSHFFLLPCEHGRKGAPWECIMGI